MATMLTGAAVMDAALLLISAEMDCPQPQTREHLAAVQLMQLKKILILQNKIDLIHDKKVMVKGKDGEETKEESYSAINYSQIKKFIKDTQAEHSPIIPISAQFRYNIDVVLQYICQYIPIPKRNLKIAPQMIVIRSFDVNKPGTTIDKLIGGIAGGSILQGVLKIGDEIEIRPGIVKKDTTTNKNVCQPIITVVKTLNAEKNQLLYAIPGGLIGLGTLMDSSLTKADQLVGNIIGFPNHLPDVYDELVIKHTLFRRLVGVKVQNDNESIIKEIKSGELLLINVGSTSCGGRVISTNSIKKTIKISIVKPVCTSVGEKVAISRKITKTWRLIGQGSITDGHIIYSDQK